MTNGPEDPDSKTEWAERRTDWAEDRTALANERTFAGWIRTALGAVAVALGLEALFRGLSPDWIAKSVASIFILTALLLVWTAERAAVRTARRMKSHAVRTQSSRRMRVIAVIVSFGAAATGGVIWLV